MKTFSRVAILTTCLVAVGAVAADSPAAQKARALLQQMTLDEKIGQMTQVDSDVLKKDPSAIEKFMIGSVLSGGNSNPADNQPETWRKFATDFQAHTLKTRLKIPVIYGVDAVHGHNNLIGATVFPHNIGLGATRNPALVQKAARATAEEIAGSGIHWAFGPCVAVVQNVRWGRSYESFGSDPVWTGKLGAAAVTGLESALPNGFQVLSCTKHYAGDGGTQNGVDQGNTVGDEATLRRLHLTPYVDAIKAGTRSIMISYNSWNGEKMHGNKRMMTDVLKGELGFSGFLVSDWAAIDQLPGNYKSDIETSINAGLDMVMIPNGPGQDNNYQQFITSLRELVAEGKVSQARIDDAVLRILAVKYDIGLFEHPNADTDLFSTIGSKEHREVARQCVRESLVVLKNEKQTLPLSKKLKHLVVVGKSADDMGVQCGGWTIDWQGQSGNVTKGTTLLAGIQQAVSADTKVTFSPDGKNLPKADAVIVVIGEQPYAEMKGDRGDLQLPTADTELVAKAKASGAPVLTVLLSGRPLILGPALDSSDAFVAAWLPGTEGQGVADVLFGDFKPTGKLPCPWPSSNEQLRVGAAGANSQPLFPLEFGLAGAGN